MSVKLEYGPEPDSLYLPIPDTVLDELDWDEGDEIVIDIVVHKNGDASHIVLTKRGT